jgi:hypothetical protein
LSEPLTIVGLGGSLARRSHSLAALRVALDGAAEAGAATALLDLRELDLPLYNPDDEGEPPPAASTLIEACYAADGMLWSSPMYRGRSEPRSCGWRLASQTTRPLNAQRRAKNQPSASPRPCSQAEYLRAQQR